SPGYCMPWVPAGGWGSMTSLAVHVAQGRGEGLWSLVAQGRDEVLPLRSFPCQVGRHPGGPLRGLAPTVSRVAAGFRQHGAAIEVADLSSRNGTFVNGQRIKEKQTVGNDDLLQFGASAFRLRSQNVTQPSLNVTSQSEDAGDLALALAQFEKLISESSIV